MAHILNVGCWEYFFAIPILLSSLFILSPSVFAASPSTVYWTNTTRFGQSVSLKYGNEYSGYVHTR